MRARYGFVVAGYGVLPEHVHLLVGEPKRAVLAKAIQALKLSVAVQREERPFWQARYYDFNVYSERKRVEKTPVHAPESGEAGFGGPTSGLGLVELPALGDRGARHGRGGVDGFEEGAWRCRNPRPKNGTWGTRIRARALRPGPPAIVSDTPRAREARAGSVKHV
jgi:hypothetical protein